MAFFREAVPFYTMLSPEQKQILEENITVHQFNAGSMIHGGTSDCAGLFLVRSGQVRAYIISETGKEITLYHLFERDICIFTAPCAMRNMNFEVMVEAEKDTVAILIPASIYSRFQDSTAAVANYTNGLMSRRFSDVMWLMEQILFTSFDRRLAAFLLEQSSIEKDDRLLITHETIARHLGTAREVVTRMMKYFASEGMVELFRGGVIIKNREKLAGIAS